MKYWLPVVVALVTPRPRSEMELVPTTPPVALVERRALVMLEIAKLVEVAAWRLVFPVAVKVPAESPVNPTVEVEMSLPLTSVARMAFWRPEPVNHVLPEMVALVVEEFAKV